MSIEEKTKQIHIKLTPELHQSLKLEAAFLNKTVQDLVVLFIKNGISRSEIPALLIKNGALRNE